MFSEEKQLSMRTVILLFLFSFGCAYGQSDTREQLEEIARAKERLEQVEQELETTFERWQELEEIAEQPGS